MSNLDDFNAKVDAITAITEDQLVTPKTIPVDAFLQDAENLYKWAVEDRDILVATGLPWDLVEDMPIRCGALREAESVWNRERYSHEVAEKLWLERSPLAYELRDDLVRQFRFAFRKDTSLLGRVDAIAEGTGHADMIQDLNDLSVLGKANMDLLAVINFDGTLLDQAAAMSAEMAELLADATRDRNDYSGPKRIRDQAYTYLKLAVDEVYKFGQFVFRKNKARIKCYRSEYLRKKRARQAAQEDTAPTGSQADATSTSVPTAAPGTVIVPTTVSVSGTAPSSTIITTPDSEKAAA